jgi:hypothetical protein
MNGRKLPFLIDIYDRLVRKLDLKLLTVTDEVSK